MTPVSSPYHPQISKRIAFILYELEQQGLCIVHDAPVDIYCKDKDVFNPDLIFIKKGRESIIGEKK
jgi:hypothetical protein